MNQNSQFEYPHGSQSLRKLLICSVGCLAALSFGGLFQPGEWYETLNRAPWNPPNIAFPIVWTTLYVMIAFSGWILSKSGNTQLIVLWWVQLGLNALWSWFFFGQQWITIALIDIAAILVLVGLLIKLSRANPDTRFAGTLLLPYAAWLCLAFSLNAYILMYN